MSDSLVSGLSAAVDSSPQDVSLRLRLAELLLRDCHPGEALAHIGAAILLRPSSSSASALLVAHPDFPKYVAMARHKAVRGSANVAARAILGLAADEPIKTGPAGKQKYAQHGRSIETVARFLQRYSAAAEPKPIRLTLTLSGSDIAGGTVVVPRDHKLYPELIALFEELPAPQLRGLAAARRPDHVDFRARQAVASNEARARHAGALLGCVAYVAVLV